jgi:hypothetical protein
MACAALVRGDAAVCVAATQLPEIVVRSLRWPTFAAAACNHETNPIRSRSGVPLADGALLNGGLATTAGPVIRYQALTAVSDTKIDTPISIATNRLIASSNPVATNW